MFTTPAGSISIALYLAVGHRAVLDSAWHNESCPVPAYVAVPQLDRQRALDDQEQLIGVIVGVPDELALDPDQFDFVIVQPGNDLGRPVLGEQRDFSAMSTTGASSASAGAA